MKKVIKSVAIFFKQSYKPLLAIVAIAVVCGGLLALGNGLFNVSDEERRERDFKKIYSAAYFSGDLEIDAQFKQNDSYGTVEYAVKAYDTAQALEKDEPSAIIVKTKSGVKGYNGYSEVVVAAGVDWKIKNVIISSYGGDDRTSSITKKYLEDSYVGRDLKEVPYFSMYSLSSSLAGVVDVSSGATSKATMGSVCAAVNMAAWYVREAGLLG